MAPYVTGLDFTKLGEGASSDTLLDPQEIFAALPLKKHSHLRAGQAEILDAWFLRRNERDLVVKANTGGGKTTIGLLMAKSALNEKKGPALILAPDTFLVEQIQREAKALGLKIATDVKTDPAFRNGTAIGVDTLARLINGQSWFGVEGSYKPVVKIGCVIVDDAHAALAATEKQFTLTVPRGDAYDALLNLFAPGLKKQSLARYVDIKEGDSPHVMRVPFWDWADAEAEILAILRPLAQIDGSDHMFVWPLIEDILPLCTAHLTSTEFEIRPPCPAINKIPSFAQASRRIYLTATMADESPLVLQFDADVQSVVKPISPKRAADLGDRMILAPQEIYPEMSTDALRTFVRNVADDYNAVVLVPSGARAKTWDGVADEVWNVDTLKANVKRLASSHVGLVVLINKYDGVDLPGDSCRLLVLDGLPQVAEGSRRREASALIDSRVLTARQMQRVEQGMGRGVRDGGDYCAVLLMDPRLTSLLHDPDNLDLLSEPTRAQLELSRQVAQQLIGQPPSQLRSVLDYCLTQDAQWVTTSKGKTANMKYSDHGSVDALAAARRGAFDRALVGQADEAAAVYAKGLKALDHPRAVAWAKEELAHYVHLFDPARAQEILAQAVLDNSTVLRPLEGVKHKRLKAHADQAKQAATYLQDTYATPTQLVLGMRALASIFVWRDEEAADDFEAGLHKVAQHLGLSASRPDHETGTGPDNLFAVGEDAFAVVEAKSGSVQAEVPKKYIDHLSGHMNWLTKHYPTATGTPLLVHATNVVEARATPAAGMRVLTVNKLAQMLEALGDMAVALAAGLGTWGDPVAVESQLSQHGLNAGALLNRFTVNYKMAKA